MSKHCLMIMSELVKVRFSFTNKNDLEKWIEGLARKGWILADFKYVMLGTMIYFRFQERSPRRMRVCLYDIKWQDDEDIFLTDGWKVLCRSGLSVIFYHEDEDVDFPLLDMKLYTGRRIYKITCNFLYVIALVYSVRIENVQLREAVLFTVTLFLFSLPALFDVKSTKKGNNMVKFLKNIVYAIIATIVVCIMIETLVKAFYVLF